jgi:glycosyltransferase involved in cell wall biosynthesis
MKGEIRMKQKKRILLMAAHFHPYKGGLENFALDLGTRLAKKGHEVDVFTYNLNNYKDVEKYRGITIYRFPCTSILGKTYTLPKHTRKYEDMVDALLRKDYDVVITNTRFFTTSYIGMNIARKLRLHNNKTKFIHIEHGNVHVIHNNPLITFIAWLYDQTLGRRIFKKADVVVGISKPCAEFAIKHGADPRKTVVIHNSIDTEYFAVKERKELNKAKLKKIIYVGRLIYAKGIHDLIDSLIGIKNVELVIIGDGPYMKTLEEISKKHHINTRFTGTINRERIRSELANGYIFVNPSYSEGLPTSILEAGAAGLPIIATDVGGTNEIVEDKLCGFLVDPKKSKQLREKIEILLSNKYTHKKFSENIRKKVEKEFDWNRNIEKFEALL